MIPALSRTTHAICCLRLRRVRTEDLGLCSLPAPKQFDVSLECDLHGAVGLWAGPDSLRIGTIRVLFLAIFTLLLATEFLGRHKVPFLRSTATVKATIFRATASVARLRLPLCFSFS